VFFVRRGDDDPEIYRRARAQLAAESRDVSLVAIFGPGILRVTLLASLLAIGAQGAAYSVSNYLTTFLHNERGLSLAAAGIYVLVNSIGGFVGVWVNAFYSDRLGRRAMFRLFGVGFVLTSSFYLLAPLGNSAWTLLPAGMVYGFFQFGIYASFGPFFTELFPTELRGSGQAFAYNIGRALSGVVFTTSVAQLAKGMPVSTAMLAMALVGIFCAIAATFMLPETAGRDLAEARMPRVS
jgi:predicted MFS family arabinose efflux permease